MAKKKEHNMRVETAYVQFPITVVFEKCEVDMALKEFRGQTIVPTLLIDGANTPIDKTKLVYTPTSDSVNFCLNWLAGFVDRNTMKIQMSKWVTDYSQPSYIDKNSDGIEHRSWPSVSTELDDL